MTLISTHEILYVYSSGDGSWPHKEMKDSISTPLGSVKEKKASTAQLSRKNCQKST